MSLYNCIIVEDEPLAVEILEDYIREIPFLQLKKVCNDAFAALEVLKEGHIHLMFLDLHLPKLKGLDFLKTLQHPPAVIITTAYHEYALTSYEYNVLDYLLKPIEFSRFLTAVNKLKPLENPVPIMEVVTDRQHLFFNVNKKMVKVYLDEIRYIESVREYVRINTTTTTLVTKMPISQLEELIPKSQFVRIHRSFIVALDKIDAFSASWVEINDIELPIGRSYKELVATMLRGYDAT